MQLCLSWMLSRVGDALDALPGEELRVAVEEARKVVACPPLFSLFFSLIFIFIFFFSRQGYPQSRPFWDHSVCSPFSVPLPGVTVAALGCQEPL